MTFSVYVCDTETTGTDPKKHDVIEVCFWRLGEPESKLWHIKPFFVENIEDEALKINGHKREDILHRTPFGRETYRPPMDVIIEIEEWIMQDGASADERVFVGQNPLFDYNFLSELWVRNDCKDSFPFGSWFKDGTSVGYLLDTIQIVRFIDLMLGNRRTRYNLGSLVSDFGVTRATSHRADGDVKMTMELLIKLMTPFVQVAKDNFSGCYKE